MGTALVFLSIQTPFADVLKKWLGSVVEKQSAVRLQFVNGSVRIYLNDVLCLEGPYISVVPTPALETDTQSKRWADYLGKNEGLIACSLWYSACTKRSSAQLRYSIECSYRVGARPHIESKYGIRCDERTSRGRACIQVSTID